MTDCTVACSDEFHARAARLGVAFCFICNQSTKPRKEPS